MRRRRGLRIIATWLALGAASASATASADDHEAEAPLLQLRPLVGIGAHSRSFQRPTETGTQTLATAYVPAIELGLRVLLWPSEDFSLAIEASYQTGLWLTVTELPAFALANEVSVRSQRLALGIAPSWRIAAQTRLAVAVGGTLRGFAPDDRALQTPSYSLLGPHLRAELSGPLYGLLSVRVSPELQWLIAIEQRVADGGNTAAMGAAIGGEIALELALGSQRTLGLSYRQSHALLMRAARFHDVERYLTLRIEEVF